MHRPIPIVLDTDIGTDVDDALCLALALASPEIDLVAVTTVSGDTRLRAAIARRLLDLAGRPDVPVFAGEATGIAGSDRFFSHGGEGTGILEPGANEPIAEEPAVQAMTRLLRERDDLELVAVGPLTNLAAVLAADPSLTRRIRRLTVMGGHLGRIAYAGCELPFGVDYNLCSDPAASVRVLGAPVPTRLVTGDVTLQTWIGPADLAAIAAPGTAFHRAIERAVRHWTPIQRDVFANLGAAIGADNVAFLHDPLALACVHDESFCTFADLAVTAEVRDDVLRTVADGSPRGRPMRCATAVDAERFRAHFVERVRGFRPA